MLKGFGRIPWLIATLTVSVICAGFLFLYFYQFGGRLSASTQVWGEFGEYVGGVIGPLLSFAAFLALLLTIRLQIQQINSSESQFYKTSKALDEQSDFLARQQFDSNFFQLLDLQKSKVERFRYKDMVNVREYVGDEVLSLKWKQLFKTLNSKDFHDAMNWYKYSATVFHEWAIYRGGHVNEFLQSTFNVIEFISKSSVGDEGKRFAYDVLKKQMSSSEYFLVFYGVCFFKRFSLFAEEALKYEFFDYLEFAVQYKLEPGCSMNICSPVYHKEMLRKAMDHDYDERRI